MICYLLVGNNYRLGDALLIYRATVQGLRHNDPVPPGRVRPAYLSRHFVPGYVHLVPTGHRRFVFQQPVRLGMTDYK
jgi:hypothetical protein